MVRCGGFSGLLAGLSGATLLGAQPLPAVDVPAIAGRPAAPTITVVADQTTDYRGFTQDGAMQSVAPGAPISGASLDGLGDAAQTRTESERGHSSLGVGPAPVTSANAQKQQRHFTSGELAVAELSRALRQADFPALQALFGAEAQDLLFSGDPVADNVTRRHFLQAFDIASETVSAGRDRMILEVGGDHWPFPIPLVQDKSGWRFDTRAGLSEIIDRRVGRNELAVIKVSLGYVDAQREYASANRAGDGLPEYARQFRSDPGKRNGLFWPTQAGQPASPLGPLVAASQSMGYGEGYTAALRPSQPAANVPPRPEPGVYYGYRYKILTRQGAAQGKGGVDYVVDGHMTGGFAMVAYPAIYRVSGVKTFIVNQQGTVYERDLGPKTESIASRMTSFDPDPRWQPANMASRGMMLNEHPRATKRPHRH